MGIETIKRRRSVRTFDGSVVPRETLDLITKFMQAVDNPFGVPVHFALLDADADRLSSPVVVGAKTYIAAKVERQERAEEAFGYSFEKVILYVTSLGLGSVWLAATLDRRAFETAMDLKPGEIMPAVSPLGYAADKMSLREKAMRRGMRSDDRAPFNELFFMGDFGHPLSLDDAGAWRVPLEMVRVAPSATNRQPWRVVVQNDAVHFYECKARGYEKSSTGDIQKVDLGIAACHFETALEEVGVKGGFIQADPRIAAPDNCGYVFSYARKD